VAPKQSSASAVRVWVYAAQSVDAAVPSSIEQKFRGLARQWKEETRFVSSVQDMVSNAAYLQIIAMGKDALPLLLNELRREPDHWFVALQAITGLNPISESARGDVRAMARSWLEWGERHGLCTSR